MQGDGAEGPWDPEENFENDAEIGSSGGSDSEDSDYRDVHQPGGPVKRQSADGFTDFIDGVADGIGNYLHLLEDRQRGRVYDRHTPEEGSRWRRCIQDVAYKALAEKEKRAIAKKAAGKKEKDEAQKGVAEAFGPCRPSLDVPFQEPVVLADGRPRLAFSACFESGNLAMAESETATSYTLYVDNDVYTTGYTQWFYFGVRGGTAGTKVTFRIANLKKAGSLFEQGMLPVVWSELAGRGWERNGSDVSYQPTNRARRKGLQRLTFSYTFEYDNDTVFFAYHYPYTYSYLRLFLSVLTSHPYSGAFAKRETLCLSAGGVDCEMLKIFNPDKGPSPTPRGGRSHSKQPLGAEAPQEEEVAQPERKVIVITGRVHPGESNASWMVHGFLLFLCSPAPEAAALRDAYDWVIIPMLNPDGVIQGNYRCGLAGVDLNRIYNNPSRKLHPEIFHLKNFLRDNPVELFIDFHGHSKKEGVFFYGGRSLEDEENAEIRLLPRLCAMASDDFNWRACNFGVQQSKLTTARLVAFLDLGIMKAYTVEASFSCAPRARGPGAAECAAEELGDGSGSDEDSERPSDLEKLKAAVREGKAPSSRAITQVSYASRWSSGEGDGDGDETLQSARMQTFSTTALAYDDSEYMGLSELPLGDSSQEPEAAAPAQSPVAKLGNFDPARLELVGPTIGRAMVAAWLPEASQQAAPNLTKEARKDKSIRWLEGTEGRTWSHLHYERLSCEEAKQELARIFQARAERGDDGGDSAGSDSAPDADTKPLDELRAIQRRLLKKLKKRNKEPEKPPEEVIQYKTIVAFGKTQRVPIRPTAPAGPRPPLRRAAPTDGNPEPRPLPDRGRTMGDARAAGEGSLGAAGAAAARAAEGGARTTPSKSSSTSPQGSRKPSKEDTAAAGTGVATGRRETTSEVDAPLDSPRGPSPRSMLTMPLGISPAPPLQAQTSPAHFTAFAAFRSSFVSGRSAASATTSAAQSPPPDAASPHRKAEQCSSPLPSIAQTVPLVSVAPVNFSLQGAPSTVPTPAAGPTATRGSFLRPPLLRRHRPFSPDSTDDAREQPQGRLLHSLSRDPAKDEVTQSSRPQSASADMAGVPGRGGLSVAQQLCILSRTQEPPATLSSEQAASAHQPPAARAPMLSAVQGQLGLGLQTSLTAPTAVPKGHAPRLGPLKPQLSPQPGSRATYENAANLGVGWSGGMHSRADSLLARIGCPLPLEKKALPEAGGASLGPTAGGCGPAAAGILANSGRPSTAGAGYGRVPRSARVERGGERVASSPRGRPSMAAAVEDGRLGARGSL